MKIFAILIIAFSIIMIQVRCSNDVPDTLDFKIVIENHYFGHTQYRTTITQDSLILFYDNFSGDTTITRRTLTEKEQKNMRRFLYDYPIDELKTEYIHPTVEDGLHMSFFLTIDKKHKEIYLANYYVELIDDLLKQVVKIYPDPFYTYNDEYLERYE